MVNPVMVEATRGRHVELRFRGTAAVVDSMGQVIRSWGDIHEPVFARSSLKLIQALPLIESGAADAYSLTPQEIALAGASHEGVEEHIEALEIWLHKLGKDERVLECGIFPAHDNKKRYAFEKPSSVHNPCSGKHLGFITTAIHRNEPLEGYISREHPAQRRVEQALSEMTDVDLTNALFGTDGCGIPAFAIPLFNIALAMARFADPSHLHYPRQKAIHRIISAIQDNPEMIAGENGFDTKIIKLTHGQIICKMGAGGAEVGVIPSLGLGIALKIDDGNKMATEIAFLAILRSLGCLEEDVYERLGPRIPVLTHKGKTTGFFQPTNFTTLFPETGHH
jgi:L-asparaginase II